MYGDKPVAHRTSHGLVVFGKIIFDPLNHLTGKGILEKCVHPLSFLMFHGQCNVKRFRDIAG
jgi:hypothetical protein